ncbi:CO or xanthine dehydrogenase, FAD-binding subunit [Dethiosulfatibacter aminovorans DSM 17477]|uniref:CO or xanthine dehydrogenase, FAD-binding subunit n=1 Tax=Dethiosulfatibacter aminovorans DSM 17477 TaxID=1121476 RepID=A0A1M6HCQ2_9FIRM|nr:FAD binding domain-containing protein [Dethiosulfatibacter aminovorans]SHJ19944.1 CO or xanthine dehydrogenase, FAD-binding subunit [Dethiosulfatibacter aminovorans DSM 17477]
MRFREIVQPTTLDEAVNEMKNSKFTVIGGGVFLKLQKGCVNKGIDLSKLGLDYIREEEGRICIGSMTTLREIEKSTVLPDCMVQSVLQIGGVGLRNIATIGGSVCGKYSFSDIGTALIALDARLKFHLGGELPMIEYFHSNIMKNDILLEISFKKPGFSSFKAFKHNYTDFALVNICLTSGDKIRIAVGARPGKAVIIKDINTKHNARELLRDVEFSSDFRGTGNYRRSVAETMLSDILKEGLFWK